MSVTMLCNGISLLINITQHVIQGKKFEKEIMGSDDHRERYLIPKIL